MNLKQIISVDQIKVGIDYLILVKKSVPVDGKYKYGATEETAEMTEWYKANWMPSTNEFYTGEGQSGLSFDELALVYELPRTHKEEA